MQQFNFHSTAEEVTEGLDLTSQTFVVTGYDLDSVKRVFESSQYVG